MSTVDLRGRFLWEVRPVGKHILLRLDDQRTLHCHLRMDGEWHLYRPGARWRRPANLARVVLAVADRQAVGFALHDLRLLRTDRESELIGHLGPDLLDPAWDADRAAEARRRLVNAAERPIGEALLDQRVVAGVGNLYRCEVCFLLGATPWAPVATVDADRAVRLGHELLRRNAWRPEQATTGDPRPGHRHWVYRRAGSPCRRCRSTIRTARLGENVEERTVYYCPRCQLG